MGRYAQLVVGPAGSGKVRAPVGRFCAPPSSLTCPWQSTYCQQLHAHCGSVGRAVHVVNLDPAAEHFECALAADVRDLVALEVRLAADVTEPTLTRNRPGRHGGARAGPKRGLAVLHGVPGESSFTLRSLMAYCIVSDPSLCRRSTPTSGCKTCSTALAKTTTCCSTARGRHAPVSATDDCCPWSHSSTAAAVAQIELYSHSPVLRSLAERMKLGGWR
jgi:hypothetical protein